MTTDIENLKARLLKISSKDSPKTNLPPRKPKIEIRPQKPISVPSDVDIDEDEDFPTEEEELAQEQEIDLLDGVEEEQEQPMPKKIIVKNPVRAIPQISKKPQFVNIQPQQPQQQKLQQRPQQPIQQPVQEPIQELQSQEEIENIQLQMLQEITRLRDNGVYRVEDIFVKNNILKELKILNEQIEKLIIALSE